MRHRWFIFGLILTLPTDSVHAGIILSLSPSTPTVTAAANSTGSITIGVQAAADSGTQTLRSYDIFVDIAPAGNAKPSGWTVSNVTEVTNFDLFTGNTTPSQGNVSASAGQLSSPAITLTTTPSTLWTFFLSFDGNSGATDGSYALTFLTGGNFGVSDASNMAISPVSTVPGTITLQNFDATATPEPSSLLLLTVAGVGWCAVRRLRQRQNTP